MAFRVLAAGNFPGHRTMGELWRRHRSDFRPLLVEGVRLAAETGMASFGTRSVDGTQVRANAARRKAMSDSRMLAEEARLAGEIAVWLERAGAVDAAEDVRDGEAVRGDEWPAEWKRREDWLAAVRAAKARQREADDARGRSPEQPRHPQDGRPDQRDDGEPRGGAQDHFTDPQNRLMKTSQDGFQPCDNAPVAVEGKHPLVVAVEVSNCPSDPGGWMPLVRPVESTQGSGPETVLADAGDCSEAELAALAARGVDGYVALGRAGRRAVAVDAGRYPAKAAMAEKRATAAGRVPSARRKWRSEAPIGGIKEVLGFRRFSVRGRDPVPGEWDRVCLALNVQRMPGLWATG